VLSKGCEVVGLGYSRLSADVARVTDRGGESGNPNRVDWVHREYDTDQWQIGLLGTVGVTGADTQVSENIGLLGTTWVTGTAA
jgi:hypothetical protein